MVRRAINSVLAQTWTDFELIVVDDGSTDRTVEALTDIADARLQVLRRDHKGVGAARNAGVELAHGELLAFLDSDDDALPTWLERLGIVLSSSPADVALCGARIIERDGSSWSLFPPGGQLIADAVAPRFLAGCYGMSRALFDAVGGFDPELEVGENTELALRLFTHRPQPLFAAVNEPLVRLRASALRSQTARAASAEAVLRRHAGRRACFPKLWASYHAIVAASCAKQGHYWQGRYHFLCAVRADPRSLEQLARLGVSLLPGGSHLVWGGSDSQSSHENGTENLIR
jgi:glycosyltransferase involved in cell wall biosynthesis